MKMSTNNKPTTETPTRKREREHGEASTEGISRKSQKKIRTTDEPSEEAKQNLVYTKRHGTTEISGLLYETKLLTLVLLRAHKAHEDEKIENFFLGTNLDGVGALDDLILSYEKAGMRKMLFVQAKHRDDPRKNKITWKGICAENGPFSIFKYFDSYLEIISKFDPNSSNAIFKTELENVEMNLIVYTSAEVDISAEKETFLEELETDQNEFLKTSDKGKIFRINFNCLNSDKIESRVKLAFERQIKQLGAKLAKFIYFENNLYKSMMEDYMIKIYHIALAKDVITKRPQGDYEIRSDFHEREGDFIKILRQELYEAATASRKAETLNSDTVEQLLKEMLEDPKSENISDLLGSILKFEKNGKLTVVDEVKGKINTEMQESIANLQIKPNVRNEAVNKAGKKILNSITFNLPLNFGNRDFQATFEVNRVAKELADSIKNCKDEKIIKIDSNTSSLLSEKFRKLVENVLIYDDKTDLWKFDEKQALSENALEFLKMVEDKINDAGQVKLENYRFDIQIKSIPVCSFQSAKNVVRKNLVNDFLSNFKFYVSRPKEDEIEKITKKEFKDRFSHKKFPFPNACDTVYSIFHENIQKWWKQSVGNYLTKGDKIFIKTFNSIIKRPYSTFLNSIYLQKIKANYIQFTEDAFKELKLNANETLHLNISTSVKEFTAIKLLQANQKDFYQKDLYHYFIDLGLGLGLDHMTIILNIRKEIGEGDITLIVDCQNQNNLDKELVNKFKKVIFLIDSRKNDSQDISESIKKDTKNSFFDLDLNSQEKLLEESKILFQGTELDLKDIVDDKVKPIIRDTVLLELLKKGSLKIGKEIENLDANVKRYFERDFFNEESSKIKESDLVDELFEPETQVIVIYADPGMGKSTVLTHMALLLKEKRPLLWLVRINLNDHTQLLKELNSTKNEMNFNFACETLFKMLNFQTTFEEDLFKITLQRSNQRDCNEKLQIVFLIDGFDEISPGYKEKFFPFLKILLKNTSTKIIVTTRPQHELRVRLHHELRDKLSARLFQLTDLTAIEQEDFFKKYFNIEKLDISDFTNLLRDETRLGKDFLSNPRHLRMIGEYFNDYSKKTDIIENIKNNKCLPGLNKEIVRKKFHEIFISEKMKVDRSNLHVQLCEKTSYSKFIKQNQILAFNFYFPLTALKEQSFRLLDGNEISKNTVENILKEFENVENGEKKYAIIRKIETDHKPQFFDNNHSVYFAGTCLAEIFISNTNEDFKKFVDSGVIENLRDKNNKEMNQIYDVFEYEIETTSQSDNYTEKSKCLENIGRSRSLKLGLVELDFTSEPARN